MSFIMDMSSYQAVCDEISAGHDEEIIFFGRAIEVIDIDPVSRQQLNLPLFPAYESYTI
jgi:hypothetical protein